MSQVDVGHSSLSRSVRSGSAARVASLSSPSKGSVNYEGIVSWPVWKIYNVSNANVYIIKKYCS